MAVSRFSHSALGHFVVNFVTISTLALLLVCQAIAQQSTQLQNTAQSQAGETESAGRPSTITVPVGTRVALVLTHPVNTRDMHSGDIVYGQVTAPLTIDGKVAVPAGTFMQGHVAKLSRDGSRGEIALQSASLIFSNGYVAEIPGPVSVETEEATAWNNPSSAAKAGVFLAPLAGLGLGAAIGSAAHTTHTTTFAGTTMTSSTPTGVAVGSLVGLGTGGLVSLMLLKHSNGFYVDVGSPMQMTLQQPLLLAARKVEAAAKQTGAQPMVVTPMPRAFPIVISNGSDTCYMPGTPATPPTVIPGTPPVGDMPGTPDIVIPGIPGTPATPYPCP